MTPDTDLPPIPGDALPSSLVERSLLGDASPAEMAAVDAWLRAHPDQRAAYRHLGEAARADVAPDLTPEGWSHLADTVVAGILRPAGAKSHITVSATDAAVRPAAVRKLFATASRPSRRAAALGGALAAALVLGTLGVYMARPAGQARLLAGGDAAPAAMHEVRTVRGQRATVRLSDGSAVTLGAESRIRYARDFGTRARDIELQGEAYFDVVHDDRVPFRVRTVHGVTEDIGTKFSVRAYPEDAASRVVVTEGSVKVGADVVLVAGDMAHLVPGLPPTVRHDAPVAQLTAWTTGRLEFVKVPLREVVRDLERWHDVAVVVDDPALANQTITAGFRDEPVSTMLEALARMTGARVVERGTVRVLVPDASPRNRGAF